jgi:hypothetical protein
MQASTEVGQVVVKRKADARTGFVIGPIFL